jgi:hypothetical protein
MRQPAARHAGGMDCAKSEWAAESIPAPETDS